jgi:hypothetical protein
LRVNKSNLAKLESVCKDYLEGNLLNRFPEDFDIKFSAGTGLTALKSSESRSTRGYLDEPPSCFHMLVRGGVRTQGLLAAIIL